MMMTMRLLIACVMLLALSVVMAEPTSAPSKSVWDGVYSKDQADRGKKAYNSLCARCHSDNLLGNDDAPALVEKDFLEKWNGGSVGDLVDLTQKKMPTDGPGKLTRKQCTDITAYLLSANGFPSGSTEMPADLGVLNTIQIQSKKQK